MKYLYYKLLCWRGHHDWEPTSEQGATGGRSYLVDECTRCPGKRRIYA